MLAGGARRTHGVLRRREVPRGALLARGRTAALCSRHREPLPAGKPLREGCRRRRKGRGVHPYDGAVEEVEAVRVVFFEFELDGVDAALEMHAAHRVDARRERPHVAVHVLHHQAADCTPGVSDVTHSRAWMDGDIGREDVALWQMRVNSNSRSPPWRS